MCNYLAKYFIVELNSTNNTKEYNNITVINIIVIFIIIAIKQKQHINVC